LKTARHLLAEIFYLAQKRGEIRRDISASEIARLTQLILLGVSVAWALSPDSSLRGTAEDVWSLLLPSLIADKRSRPARVRRIPSAGRRGKRS
jgi:hypothetical protein